MCTLKEQTIFAEYTGGKPHSNYPKARQTTREPLSCVRRIDSDASSNHGQRLTNTLTNTLTCTFTHEQSFYSHSPRFEEIDDIMPICVMMHKYLYLVWAARRSDNVTTTWLTIGHEGPMSTHIHFSVALVVTIDEWGRLAAYATPLMPHRFVIRFVFLIAFKVFIYQFPGVRARIMIQTYMCMHANSPSK